MDENADEERTEIVIIKKPGYPTLMTLNGHYLGPEDFHWPIAESVLFMQNPKKFQALPDDIWICSYPRCGSTWVQNIVFLLLHQGEPLPDEAGSLNKFCLFAEYLASSCEKRETPGVWKTHLVKELVPWNEKAK